MTTLSAPDLARYAPDAPFRFVGGHPSADLVNTCNWLATGIDRDRLSDYGRLIEWAEGAHVLGATAAARLRKSAAERPEEAAAAVVTARGIRSELQRMLTTIARSHGDASPADVPGSFAPLVADVVSRLRVTRARAGGRAALRWTWDDPDARLDAVLWPVVWSAAQLLTSNDAAKLRVCGGPDCGWVYVDRSRNGFRRWCEMSTCGTQEKSRRRAERRRFTSDATGA